MFGSIETRQDSLTPWPSTFPHFKILGVLWYLDDIQYTQSVCALAGRMCTLSAGRLRCASWLFLPCMIPLNDYHYCFRYRHQLQQQSQQQQQQHHQNTTTKRPPPKHHHQTPPPKHHDQKTTTKTPTPKHHHQNTTTKTPTTPTLPPPFLFRLLLRTKA